MGSRQKKKPGAASNRACGYRKFHILGAEVVAAGKARRVTLTQESDAGLADQWQVQRAREVHLDGFTEPDALGIASCRGSIKTCARRNQVMTAREFIERKFESEHESEVHI